MRSIIICAFVLFMTAGVTGAEKKFGKAITVKEVTKVSAILANPDAFNGKKVLVEGPIVDVCKERGCWIKIGSDKEFESITFKVDDGVIVFPLTIKGKSARAEGVVQVKKVSVEDLVKAGEEKAQKEGTTFDAATIKGPKVTVRLMGEGALVK